MDPARWFNPVEVAMAGRREPSILISFLLLLPIVWAALAIDVGVSRAQGNFLGKWGTAGTGPGQFNHVFGITNDSEGFFYVTDLGNHRVQKFTPEGVFVREWGTFGSNEGQFVNPTGIAWSETGGIYVADHQNHRVCRFSTDGDLLGCFGEPGEGRVNFSTRLESRRTQTETCT